MKMEDKLNCETEQVLGQLIASIDYDIFKFLKLKDLFNVRNVFSKNIQQMFVDQKISRTLRNRYTNNKRELKRLKIEITNFIDYNNPDDSVRINLIFNNKEIKNLSCDDLHLFYRQFKSEIDKVEVVSVTNPEPSSTNRVFGFKTQFLDTIRSIKYGDLAKHSDSYIHIMEIIDDSMNVFDNFLLLDASEDISTYKLIDVLKNLTPILWLKPEFIKSFVEKHLKHEFNMNYIKIYVYEYENSIEYSLEIVNDSNDTSFEFICNSSITCLIAALADIGQFVRRISILLKINNSQIEDDILPVIMSAIELECFHLENIEILIRETHEVSLFLKLNKTYPFLNHIIFLNNISKDDYDFFKNSDLEDVLCFWTFNSNKSNKEALADKLSPVIRNKCEEMKNNFEHIYIELIDLDCFYYNGSMDCIVMNLKFGTEELNDMTIDEFHLLYKNCEDFVERLEVRPLEVIDEKFCGIIKCIKYGKCDLKSLVTKLDIIDDEMKMFDYFLIDGMLKYCSFDEKMNVLEAFAPYMWMKPGFLENFLYKHIQHYAKGLIHILIYRNEYNEIHYSLIFETKFESNRYIHFEDKVEHLIAAFLDIGHHFKTIKILCKDFQFDYSDCLWSDHVMLFVMQLFQLICPNIEKLKIEKYIDHMECQLLETELQLDKLLDTFSFLHNINFVNNKFAALENSSSRVSKLLHDDIRKTLTMPQFESVLKQPLEKLYILAKYNHIYSWDFVQNITFDDSITPSSPRLDKLKGIYIYGGKKNDLCIGELFLGLFKINGNVLSLDFVKIKNYTFKEYNVPKDIKIELKSIALHNCQFSETADGDGVNNILKIFQNVHRDEIKNTEISKKMLECFGNISEISFSDSSFLTDDRILEIYKTCTNFKVRANHFSYTENVFNNKFFFTLQKWSVINCAITDLFVYNIIFMQMKDKNRECLSELKLPELYLNSPFCSESMMEIINEFASLIAWDAVFITDNYSGDKVLVIEQKEDLVENFIKLPLPIYHVDWRKNEAVL